MNLFWRLLIDQDPQAWANGRLSETELADLLENYIAWLATEHEGPGFHLIAHHFDLSGYRRQLRDDVRACKLGASEASHFFFVAALSHAHKLSEVILNNNVSSAKIRCLYAALKTPENGDHRVAEDLDEDLLEAEILGKHTEELRKLLATRATINSDVRLGAQGEAQAQ